MTDTVDAMARLAHRRRNVQAVYTLVLGVVAGTVAFVLEYGLVVGLVAAAGIHVLLHAPVFSISGRATMRTDCDPERVREQLTAPHNPLTATWFDATEEHDVRDGTARLTATVLGGLVEREWVVGVEPGSPIRLTVRRDGTALVAATVDVEPVADGTRVTITADRVRVRPMTLLYIAASGSQYAAHFAAHGYEMDDEERSIGLSPRGGAGLLGDPPADGG